MKNLLKVSLIFATICLFATSCTTSKKQNCDAYGNISVVEDSSSDLTSNSKVIIEEAKS